MNQPELNDKFEKDYDFNLSVELHKFKKKKIHV